MELTRGRYHDDVQDADNHKDDDGDDHSEHNYDDVQDADNDKDDDGGNHSEHDCDDETFSEYAIHIA